MAESLQSVRQAATAWRRTRKNRGKGGRLPDALKRRAVELLEAHTCKQVAQAVGVSDGRLVQGWQQQFRRPVSTPAAQAEALVPAFVEIPQTRFNLPVEPEPALTKVELLGQGGSLRLRGQLEVTVIRALAQVVLESRGVVS